ncbi:hypothetical protein CHS0354_008402 [Potamilus streckersoni]|uniref:Uncharacterized protein n=1 Tax=Potamilus streckersoni TaxID=2493646 RepID=A0AAE0RPN0_9BIVA|nr:hypothetical protein CHS0354_008402 [Potamilus streckersoni]
MRREAVKEDLSRFCNENHIDHRMLGVYNLHCEKNGEENDEYGDCVVPDKETSEKNTLAPVQTPGVELEPNVMVALATGVMSAADDDTETDKLLKLLAYQRNLKSAGISAKK